MVASHRINKNYDFHPSADLFCTTFIRYYIVSQTIHLFKSDGFKPQQLIMLCIIAPFLRQQLMQEICNAKHKCC
jgi:hypothetical protein